MSDEPTAIRAPRTGRLAPVWSRVVTDYGAGTVTAHHVELGGHGVIVRFDADGTSGLIEEGHYMMEVIP